MGMPKVQLTDEVCARLEPGKNRGRSYSYGAGLGLIFVVLKGGGRVWRIRIRSKRKKGKSAQMDYGMSLGRFPEVGVKRAVEIAKKIKDDYISMSLEDFEAKYHSFIKGSFVLAEASEFIKGPGGYIIEKDLIVKVAEMVSKRPELAPIKKKLEVTESLLKEATYQLKVNIENVATLNQTLIDCKHDMQIIIDEERRRINNAGD